MASKSRMRYIPKRKNPEKVSHDMTPGLKFPVESDAQN